MVLIFLAPFAASFINYRLIIPRFSKLQSSIELVKSQTRTNEKDIGENRAQIAENSKRIDKLDDKIDDHSERITRVEARLNINPSS